jgi:hypothetical protein
MQGLDDNSNHSSETCADRHGWHEYTTRNFTAVRNDDEAYTDDRGQQERIDHFPLLGRSTMSACPRAESR